MVPYLLVKAIHCARERLSKRLDSMLRTSEASLRIEVCICCVEEEEEEKKFDKVVVIAPTVVVSPEGGEGEEEDEEEEGGGGGVGVWMMTSGTKKRTSFKTARYWTKHCFVLCFAWSEPTSLFMITLSE